MKSFLAKVYQDDGTTFLGVLNGIRNEPSFKAEMNGGYGECVLEVNTDPAAMDTLIAYMRFVKIYVYDDNHQTGTLIYTGFISQYAPYIRASEQGVRVTLLGLVSLLTFDYYKDGNSYTVAHAADDPADICKAILDHAKGVWDTQSGTPMVAVTDTAHDGFEATNTTWYQNGDANELLYAGAAAGSGNDMDIGVIFPAINIPQGATITSATVSGYGYGDSSANPVKLLVKGFAADNAELFTSGGANRPSTRTKTTANVAWEVDHPFSWGWRESPDIAAVVQEIIDRPGWQSGNNLGLVLENNASAAGASLALQDYAYSGGQKLKIEIEWAFVSQAVKYDQTATTVAATGVSATYTFTDKKWLDAIKEAVKQAGAGWWWLIDKQGEFWLQEKPASATHTFTVGKDIESFDGELTSEEIINAVQVRYNGGTVDDTDSTSITAYWRRGAIVDDASGIQNSDTATARAATEVDGKKDPARNLRLVVNSNYDLESIRPGDTCKIQGLRAGNGIVSDNMQIVSLQYSLDKVTLELESQRRNLGNELTKLLA